jgi:site-specific recombinase XerD
MTAKTNQKELELLPLFLRFINDCKTGRRMQANGKFLSKGCIQNYEYVYKLLLQFSETNQFHLRIKPANKLNSRQLITEKNYWARFYKKFTTYLYSTCGHYDNYVGANIKVIRVFFNYLQKEVLLDTGNFYKKFYVPKEEVPVIALLPEELNFLIYNKEFEAKLSPLMQKVKDVFVFGCTVALRFSDLMQLKQTNLRTNGTQWYLLVRSQKTNTDTQVRLPEYGIAIIQKYLRKQKTLLPHFNKTNMNKYVKLLCAAAGFVQPVQKQRSRRGVRKKPAEQPIRFADLVTTHTMRRSAITVMLSMGVPEQVVRKISGHAPGSKEFYRYVAVAQTYQDQETEKMFMKMKQMQVVAAI